MARILNANLDNLAPFAKENGIDEFVKARKAKIDNAEALWDELKEVYGDKAEPILSILQA